MSLKKEFQDKDYRRAYAESFANTVIATQIRLLRGSMTQQEFADLVGMKQSRVSAMEDENYSMWSTKTLKKLAAAKDVVFLGRFFSFGELLNWSGSLSEAALTVNPFDRDPAFFDTPAATSSTTATYITTYTVSVPSDTTPADPVKVTYDAGAWTWSLEPKPQTTKPIVSQLKLAA